MSKFHLATIAGLLLLVGGCQQIRQSSEFGERLIDFLTGQTPRAAAIKMEDSTNADERWRGIDELVDRRFGRRPPYTDRYEQIAQSDPDWLVRATAVRALNRSRDAEAGPVFIKALNDPSEYVRLEGAKALVNLPNPNAIAPLVKVVNNPNESKDTRIAAAEALRHYRRLDVARALIAQLGGKDFGLAWQSHKSLINITGKDLSYDESAWLNFVTGPDKPFG